MKIKDTTPQEDALAASYEGMKIQKDLVSQMVRKVKNDLYHICEKDSEHKAWGIYRKSKRGVFNLFRLITICFDYDNAIKQAKALAEKEPDKDFSIQGAKLSDYLPEKYNP